MMPATLDDVGMQVTQAPLGSISVALSNPPQFFSSAPGSVSMTTPAIAPTEPMVLSGLAGSSVSGAGGASGSNAFEESLDAFSFGAEPSGPDSWMAFAMSSDWLDMTGHLPPDGT